METDRAITFDADSLKGGKTVRTIVGDHNDRITDMTALIVERNDLALDCYNQDVNDKVFKTLSSSASDSDHVPCVVQEKKHYYAIEGNGQRESHHGSGFCEGTMYTLNATEEHGVCYQQPICFTDREGKDGGGKGILCSPIPGALRASGSYYLCDEDRRDVACIGHDERQSFFGKDGKADTLLNNDYKSPQIVAYEEIQKQPHRKYIVRRLTPKECCRLQGFPDWWEDGVEGSQAERYKMWGNGVGLPNVCDVLFRIKYYLEKEGKNYVSNK